MNAEQPSEFDASGGLRFHWMRRVPTIRQTEAAECGLACLAMIAGYFGHHVGLGELRQRRPVSIKGMTLADIVDTAELLGLASRPLKLDMSEIGHLSTPSIIHWNLTHYVVLEKVGKDWIQIVDPANGPRRISLKEAGKLFTGIAVEFTTTSSFERVAPPPGLSLRKLAGKISGLRRAVVAILSLALVLEVLTLLGPQYLQLTVDQVLSDQDHDLLVFLGLTFCGLLLLQTVVSAVRTWALLWIGTQFTFNWTGNVFRHLLKLPQGYFFSRHIGDIASRFSAISTIQQTLTTQLVSGVLDGAMALATLCLLFAYSWLLALITLAAVLLYGGSRLLYFRTYREANLSQIVVESRRQSRFIESVKTSQTIRLANQQPIYTARYLNSTTDVLNTQIAVQKLGLVFDTLNGLTSGIQRIAVLWIGGWLGLSGNMSAGMLVAFVSYADQFVSRSGSLIDYLIQMRLLRLQGERLADIVMTRTEPFLHGSYAGELDDTSLQFDDVSFRYSQSERWIAKGCSARIESGESVAIVGPSGGGKSTLLRLLTGLLDPETGRILIGGVDLKKLGKSRFRAMCGIVMQDDQVFSGNIADNISMFDPEASLERIQEAARLAQIHVDIATMPMGYNSLVGSMGSALSGGQFQRLLLARALYRKPQFLLLDESSSHLDLATESAINHAISALRITRLIIAHRPETIRSADRVFELRNGRLVELMDPDHLDDPTVHPAVTQSSSHHHGGQPVRISDAADNS